MSFAPDGDRSTKKLWFAKKQLAIAKMLGLVAKTGVYNGFTAIAKRIGDGLDQMIITAPIGAVVISSRFYGTGMDLIVNDNWKGSADSMVKHNVLFRDPAAALSISVGTKSDVSSENVLPANPVPTQSPFATLNEAWVPGTSYWLNDANPEPVVYPYKQGEAFFIGTDMLVAGEDEAIVEFMMNYYAADGSGLSNRTFCHFETQLPWLPPVYCYQSIPATYFAAVGFQHFIQYDVLGGKPFAAAYLWHGVDETSYYDLFYNEDLFTGIPSGLESILLTVGNNSAEVGLGSYAWALAQDSEPTLLHAVDVTNTATLVVGAPDQAWFTANPAQVKWKLFYTIKTRNGSLSTVNSDAFVAALNTIDPGVGNPITSWNSARRAMYQLFGRPVSNWQVPHDTVTFHAHDGDVYVYTRKYGQFKITTTGISSGSFFSVPAEISTTGVRPTITYAGNDGVSENYLCVCEDLAAPREVKKVYYGSPFASWTALPDPSANFHLKHIRPMKVTSTEIRLLGIMFDEVTPGYYLAFLDYDTVTGGDWVKMGKIPVDSADDVLWSVGLFGKGQIVDELNNYNDPPDVMQQMPVCSIYTDYDQP